MKLGTTYLIFTKSNSRSATNICVGGLRGEKLQSRLNETMLNGQKCLHDALAVNQRLDTQSLLQLMTASHLTD